MRWLVEFDACEKLLQPKTRDTSLSWYARVYALVTLSFRMNTPFTHEGSLLRRGLALFACFALLYFTCGGALLHEHTSGPETPCHVCQALHMPALATASVAFAMAPAPVVWLPSISQHAAPNDSFSLHRPSRAPPLARVA
jgi:hypothetical protein